MAFIGNPFAEKFNGGSLEMTKDMRQGAEVSDEYPQSKTARHSHSDTSKTVDSIHEERSSVMPDTQVVRSVSSEGLEANTKNVMFGFGRIAKKGNSQSVWRRLLRYSSGSCFFLFGHPLSCGSLLQGIVIVLAVLDVVDVEFVFAVGGILLCLVLPGCKWVLFFLKCRTQARLFAAVCFYGFCIGFIAANGVVVVRAASCPVDMHKVLWNHDSEKGAYLASIQSYTCSISTLIAASIFVTCARHKEISAHEESSLNCLSTMWLTHVFLTIRKVRGFCDIGNFAKYAWNFAQGFSIAGFFLCAVWTYILVMWRIWAIEFSMGKGQSHTVKRIRRYTWAVIVFFVLTAVTMLAVMQELVKRSTITFSLVILFGVIDAICWVAVGIIATNAFREPIRRVTREMERTTGSLKEENRFARKCLIWEAVAAAVSTTSSFILGNIFLYQIFVRFFLLEEDTEDPKLLDQQAGNAEVSYLLETVSWNIEVVLNCLSIAILSGLFSAKSRALPSNEKLHHTQKKKKSERTRSEQLWYPQEWQPKVKELGERGILGRYVFEFYKLAFTQMQTFDHKRSTTNDVVRQMVIPASQEGAGGRAWSSIVNKDRPVLAERMITHSWNNLFRDLVAAVVADVLQESNYDAIAQSLSSLAAMESLEERLKKSDGYENTYWICIFCVNQHSCICSGFGRAPDSASDSRAYKEWDRKRRDSVTGNLFQLCGCQQPKYFNDMPVQCEMNKFSAMMDFLSDELFTFEQITALDRQFDLFERAWCIAELVEASESGIIQKVIVHSQSNLEEHYRSLSRLDVRRCKSTRPEDKEEILGRISDIESFNQQVRHLIFGTNGFLTTWLDAEARNAGVGRIIARALRPELEELAPNE